MSMDNSDAMIGRLSDLIHHIIEIIGPAIDFEKLCETDAKRLKQMIIIENFRIAGVLPKTFIKGVLRRASHCYGSLNGSCIRRYPGQLASDEVAQMKSMVQDTRYGHLSLCSLAWFARRQGLIHCGVQSWYKYASKNKWQRPIRQVKSKRRYQGLKAKYLHEYWHQDVTKICLENGDWQCLQVILDNRSRAVLSWKISDSVGAKDSAELILQAKAYVRSRSSRAVHLVVDGGAENIGKEVTRTYDLGRPRILRRVARKEIRHANTMVEVFFKGLKSNYLNHKKVMTAQELSNAVKYYIDQYNGVIPRAVLKGLTPNEVLRGVDFGLIHRKLREMADKRRERRLQDNKESGCKPCVLAS